MASLRVSHLSWQQRSGEKNSIILGLFWRRCWCSLTSILLVVPTRSSDFAACCLVRQCSSSLLPKRRLGSVRPRGRLESLRAGTRIMAGWDRYGEDKKYRKDVDINDNPKHVGEPLRKLTLEDRLEIRKQTREQQKKKRSIQAEIRDEHESDEELVASPKKPKQDEGEVELDIIGVAPNGKSKEVVDLAEDDGKRAAIRRARRRAKAKAKQKPAAHPEVEVLE